MDEKELIIKGDSLAKLKRYEEAIEAYEKAIELDPKDAYAWVNKGFALDELKRYEEAIEAYEKAIELDPKNDFSWVSKGISLWQLKRYEEAIEAYEKAIELNPKNDFPWVNKGISLSELTRYEEAIEAYEKAIEINPKNAYAWINKGINLSELTRYEEAIEAHEKAIEINPKNAYAWINKGVGLRQLKRYKEAIEAYEKAIEINPEEALGYSNLGELFFYLGNIKDASKNAKDAHERNKNLVSALTLQGRINIEEKDYADASESFKRAISLDIGNPKHFLWEAYASYLNAKFSFDLKSEKYQEELIGIIRNLERANLITEKHGEKMKPYILYFLGCFYLKSEDIFSAKKKFEECIKLKSPIETSAREVLGNIWNYQIRPPWWRWWLKSPLYTWPKRIGFSILAMFILTIFASLFLHPFISWWFFPLQINWTLYGFLITILIIILISPSIEHIKVKDVDLVMCSPPPFGPVLSPMVMEEKIKEIEKKYPELELLS